MENQEQYDINNEIGQANEQIANDNLALMLSEDKLQDIGQKVVKGFEDDISSREKWEEGMETFLKLFAGDRDPKNFPYECSANLHIPLMGISCLQFQARAYHALVPSSDIVKCKATDGNLETVQKAERCQAYINWQIYEQMEEWEEEQDKNFLLLAIFGSTVKKTYYDAEVGRLRSKILSPSEFVANYNAKSLDEAYRKTHFFNKTLNSIKVNQEVGYYRNVEFKGGASTEFMEKYHRRADKINGEERTIEFDENNRLILEQHTGLDLNGDGVDENYIITVDYSTGEVLRIMSRDFIDTLTLGEKTIEFFTAYQFIPNPESWQGLGFGHLLFRLNEGANSIVNQLIDAGTLANTATGFINRRSGIKRGDVKVKIGQFSEVDANVEDLSKAIYHLNFQQPSPALFNLLGLVTNYSRELATISDTTLGKMPPSDTAATSMQIVVEQGMQVFTAIHKRIHRAFRQELKKIFFLNSIYLDEKVYFTVQDSGSSSMETLQTGRLDFSDGINVTPSGDPSVSSWAEQWSRFQQMIQIAQQSPVMQNPETIYKMTKMGLHIIMRGREGDIMPPPPQPQAPPDNQPVDENAMFITGQSSPVLPQQDHRYHLQVHTDFEMSPFWAEVPANGKNIALQHKQEHIAELYKQMAQEAQNAGIAGANGGMGGIQGMVQPPADGQIPFLPQQPQNGFNIPMQ